MLILKTSRSDSCLVRPQPHQYELDMGVLSNGVRGQDDENETSRQDEKFP